MQRNRKNRSRKRKPAVRTGRRTAPPVLKSAAILVVAIIFILIIIPFTITMVFTSDSQEGAKEETRARGAQPEELQILPLFQKLFAYRERTAESVRK